MRRLATGIFAWTAITTSALASANVSCLIDDNHLRFELEAIAGRSGPITQVQVGTFDIKPAAKVQLLSPQLSFDHSHIVQQWLFDGDLRLQIEIDDAAAKQYVNLVVFARLDRPTEKYRGRYLLKILRASKAIELKGRIKECEAG